MDYTHLHLLLNHFPIVGTLIGMLILLYGIWKKDYRVQKISLGTLVLMTVIAVPVYFTGEPAEETVEHITGISKTMMDAHEEAAELAIWTMAAAGTLALINLIVMLVAKKTIQPLALFTLIAAVVTFSLMARTGYLGGQIRHTEISGKAGQAQVQAGEQGDDD